MRHGHHLVSAASRLNRALATAVMPALWSRPRSTLSSAGVEIARQHQAGAEIQLIIQPIARRGGRVACDPRGKCLSRLTEDRVVQRHQRLKRRVGRNAARRTQLPLRGIERDQARIDRRPLDEGVDGAAITVGPGRILPAFWIVGHGIPDPLGLLAASPAVRPLRDLDRPLAKSAWSRTISARQPLCGAMREQPVAGIDGAQGGCGSRALAIGRAGHHFPQ